MLIIFHCFSSISILNVLSSKLSFCEKEVTGPAGEYQYRGEGHGTEYHKKFMSSEMLSGWMGHVAYL
jgi:hypothetical protein